MVDGDKEGGRGESLTDAAWLSGADCVLKSQPRRHITRRHWPTLHGVRTWHTLQISNFKHFASPFVISVRLWHKLKQSWVRLFAVWKTRRETWGCGLRLAFTWPLDSCGLYGSAQASCSHCHFSLYFFPPLCFWYNAKKKKARRTDWYGCIRWQ